MEESLQDRRRRLARERKRRHRAALRLRKEAECQAEQVAMRRAEEETTRRAEEITRRAEEETTRRAEEEVLEKEELRSQGLRGRAILRQLTAARRGTNTNNARQVNIAAMQAGEQKLSCQRRMLLFHRAWIAYMHAMFLMIKCRQNNPHIALRN